MPTLRLRQTFVELGVHRVDVHLEDGRSSAQVRYQNDSSFGHKRGWGAAILHPALPTLLSEAFELAFPKDERRGEATRAFAKAMAVFGGTYHSYYQTDSDAATDLELEAQNLRHALLLARANG